MGDVFHPDGGIVKDFRMIDSKLPGHDGDVAGGSVMAVRIQTAAVDEMRVFHAKGGSPLVHFGYKGVLAAGDVLSHGHTRSI